MALIDTLFRRPTITAALERATAAENQLEIVSERLGSLELALEDEGWTSLLAGSATEFSRAGLGKAAELCRVMAVGHPLIKRGLLIRQAYVFGQGVEISARDADVNEVLQQHVTDPGNVAALYGDQAQEQLERAHGTDGNVFLACFTNPYTGAVQVRSLPFAEIQDIISNPEDSDEPWFYKRVWERRIITPQGRIETVNGTTFYPDIRHYPKVRPRTLDGHEVAWDAPVKHSKVNDLDGWSFGIGDAYTSLPWARAYKEFLADWATLMKSLSQYAWRATTGKPTRSQQLRARLARRPTTAGVPGNETSAGATAVLGPDVTLEAVPKTGATLDSESGRPLATLIAAGMGLPVTTLLADPGQTGARAVAETLDQPTRLEMQQRQAVWQNLYQDIAEYVIRQAVKAPRGPLSGTVIRDPFTSRELVTLAGDADATVEAAFPSLKQTPVNQVVDAIVKADSTQKMPPLTTVRLLLQALGVEDIDSLLEEMKDEEGRWIDPLITAGQAAVDAYRRGEDPAQVA